MYYRKGQLGLFKRLLEVLLEGISLEDTVKDHIYGKGPEAERRFYEDLVRVYNKLASERAMASLEARRARDDRAQREAFDDAKAYFDMAARARGGNYDQYEEETMAQQGWAFLTVGDNWEGAAYWLKGAMEVRNDLGLVGSGGGRSGGNQSTDHCCCTPSTPQPDRRPTRASA